MTLVMLMHAGVGALYLVLGLMVLSATRPDRTSYALAACCLMTSAWAAGVAWAITDLRFEAGLDVARAGAWYGFALVLYRRAVPNGSRLGGVLSAMGLVTVVAAGAAVSGLGLAPDAMLSIGIDARLGLAVCTILLLENLYRNTADDLRWHVALPCVALCGLSVYEIVLYSDAALFRRVSPGLLEARAAVLALLVPMLAVAARRNRRRWGKTIQISHRAVFYSASLVVVGVFLLALAATGEIVRQFGAGRDGDWGLVLEVSLICGGLLAVAALATSGSARSGLRHLIINNFLSHRYDYRVEWLRCIATLSRTDADVALHVRVIKAVAQVVDSPAGMVFLREPDDGVFRWAGSWNLPPAGAAIQAGHPLVALFRDGGWVVEAPAGMPWLDANGDARTLWLAVPLSHAGILMGFTLLAPARAPFVLDTEVFALLRIVGQEVASYVAEQRAAETVLQTRQLREYGQRFAFVAHDIKNVASQLSLLLSNAEHHISNPAFQRDMLGTVGASVRKITALLERLKAPAEDTAAQGSVNVGERLAEIVAATTVARRGRITLRDSVGEGRVAMSPGAFDAVVTHLLDNAFEASAPDVPVTIDARLSDSHVLVDITDRGVGMTAEYIREKLFRPFSSSKPNGFGIGVYQARALLRDAGGDLLVTSAPGYGTTMQLVMPCAEVDAPYAPALQAAR